MKFIDKTNNIIEIHKVDADCLSAILEDQDDLDTSELETALKSGRTIVLIIKD